MSQFFLIYSVYEIFMHNSSGTYKLVSLIFAILSLCLWCCWTFLVLLLSLTSYKVNENQYNFFGEFFCGVKMEKKHKMYTFILLIRLSLFVILLITLVNTQWWIVISILSVLQLWYFSWILAIRPFDSARDNLIEILNELFFLILLSSLNYLNSEEIWNSANSLSYMGYYFKQHHYFCYCFR